MTGWNILINHIFLFINVILFILPVFVLIMKEGFSCSDTGRHMLKTILFFFSKIAKINIFCSLNEITKEM